MSIYYWDRERDRFVDRTFWTLDEQLRKEFSGALSQVPGEVPGFSLTVEGLEEGRLKTVGYHLCDLVRSAGVYPRMMRMDRKSGMAAVEATGDLTERRRELMDLIIEAAGIIGKEDLVVLEGHFSQEE